MLKLNEPVIVGPTETKLLTKVHFSKCVEDLHNRPQKEMSSYLLNFFLTFIIKVGTFSRTINKELAP